MNSGRDGEQIHGDINKVWTKISFQSILDYTLNSKWP